MLTCPPADLMARSARKANHFACQDACCQQANDTFSAAVSRSLEAPAALTSRATTWQSTSSPSSNLRSSGPPRVGWRTPEKEKANALTRSLPLAPDYQLLRGMPMPVPAPSMPPAAASAASAAAPAAPAPAPSIDVVDAACRLLERVVGACLDEAARPEQVFAPIFHSVSVPGISGGDYLRHHLLRLGLARKEHLAEAIVLHAFLLIDRLLHAQSANGFHLCQRNVHRVLLATTLLSAKLLDDECYNNTYWASVGGVSLPHLNQLEVEAMSLLNFSMLVNAPSLDAARQRLLASA